MTKEDQLESRINSLALCTHFSASWKTIASCTLLLVMTGWWLSVQVCALYVCMHIYCIEGTLYVRVCVCVFVCVYAYIRHCMYCMCVQVCVCASVCLLFVHLVLVKGCILYCKAL